MANGCRSWPVVIEQSAAQAVTGTVSVRVLLIWRFSHHASYFRALATQSSLEMVPFSKEDLPAITLAGMRPTSSL